MEDKVTEETTALDYIKLLTEAVKGIDKEELKLTHHGPKKLIESVFKPLLTQGLLSSKKVSTAIDIGKLIKDKKKISVLVLQKCPKRYWGFLVHFFMNHISKILGGFGTTHRIKQKTTITLNEVADLLSDDEEKGSSSYSIAKMIGRIAKQSRTMDIFLNMDTQLPGELPQLKETMKRVYVYNSSISSVQKAMQIIGISEAAGDIGQEDYAIIPRLDKGWYYLFDRENGVSIHKLEWLRSRTYLEGEDFFDIYDKVYGKTAYQDIRLILEELKLEEQKSKKVWDMKKDLYRKAKISIVKRDEMIEDIPIIKPEEEMDYEAMHKLMKTI